MLKKLIAVLGIGVAANGSATAAELYKPYAESHVNFLYNRADVTDFEAIWIFERW